jgi:hypothetical protein
MAAVKVVAFLAFFTLLSLSWKVEAAVINAASCSRADVATAVATASDGDTVQVPAGTCTWTSTLRVTKGITLAGAGIDQTIIRDDVPRTGGGRVIEFDTGLGVNWRLTGLTFRSGTVTDWNWNGLLLVAGRSHAFRIDHVKIDNPNATAIRLYGDARGVIDHSQFYTTKNGQFMVVNHTSWNGVGSYGDNSWASPTALGTADAVYFEDNVFTVVGVLQTVIDSTGGGRYVARYNAFNNASAGGHGADSSQRNRSLRSFEFYNNTFTYPGTGGFAAIYVRGGTGVVFNNTFSGYQNAFLGAAYRSFQSFPPWGRCDGTSPYDGNSGLPAGYPCLDQVGRGAGNLLSGAPPSPVAWPNQAVEPVYTWGNTLNGASINGQHAPVQVGRDVLLNTVNPGYEPFVYPHALVTTGGTPPAPPTNLRVQ